MIKPKLTKPKKAKGLPSTKGLANILTGIGRSSNPYRGLGKSKKGLKFTSIIKGLR